MGGTRLQVVLLVIAIVLVGCGKEKKTFPELRSTGPLDILFDSVSSEQQTLLRNDLTLLQSMPQGTGDTRTWEVSQYSGAGFREWARPRIRIILGRDFSFTENLMEPDNSRYELWNGKTLASSLEGEDLTDTLMMNVGAYLYLSWQQYTDRPYTITALGRTVIANTPRVGMLWIGDRLFDGRKIESSPIDSFANSVIRLSTLVHEMRHDDGNGANACFKHVKCLKTYQSPVCDSSLNGPNGVAYAFLAYAFPLCSNCTSKEIEGLRIRMGDAAARIRSDAIMEDITPVNPS